MKKSRRLTEPLWTPGSGITYSALSTFLQCREQFRLAYVEGWSPKGTPDSLEFGSVFHYFCEHFDFEQYNQTESRSFLEKSINQFRHEILLDWKERGIILTDEMGRLLEVALLMFRCYILIQPSNHIRWIAREETFSVPISVPIGRTLDGSSPVRTINLRGKRDGIFYFSDDPANIWLFETKTKSIIDDEGLTLSLSMDLQTSLYAIAAELQTGKQIHGVLYNVIRRPRSAPKSGESLQAYLSRLESNVLDSPSHYFHRRTIKYEPNDLRQFRYTILEPMLNQLLDWWEALSTSPSSPTKPNTMLHYANPEALYNRYGRCQLFELLATGNTMAYKRREHVFPELQPDAPARKPKSRSALPARSTTAATTT